MEDVLRRLRADLGPSAAVAVADPRRPPPELFPEERTAVARAVEKRRREHAWGRHLARTALARLGGPLAALPAQADRRPAWPPGFIGSISHCDDLCAVAVGRADELQLLGIDVEPQTPLEADLWPVIATARERERLELHPAAPNAGHRAKRLFVIKEAFYKAQFELTRTMLDFLDVEVTIDADGWFRAEATKIRIGPIQGRFAQSRAHAWAWACSQV